MGSVKHFYAIVVNYVYFTEYVSSYDNEEVHLKDEVSFPVSFCLNVPTILNTSLIYSTFRNTSRTSSIKWKLASESVE